MKKLIFLVLALAGIMTSSALAYDESQIIFKDDFEGRTKFDWNKTTGVNKNYFGVADGYGTVDATKAQRVFDQDNLALDISSFMEITFDMKFKVTTMDTTASEGFPTITYGSGENLFLATISEGKIVVKGMGDVEYALGEGLEEGKEYSLVMVRNYADNTLAASLLDDQGESIDSTILPYEKENGGTLKMIRFISPKGWNFAIDHVIVASTGFDLVSEDIDEKAARTDAEFNLKFTSTVDTGYEDILLLDAKGNEVLREVTVTGNVINIKMPAGLEYDSEYTLSIPNTIISKDNKPYGGKDIEFKTEAAPFKVTKVETTKSADGATATLTYVNNSGFDQTVEVLVLVYEKIDGEDVLVDMLVEQVALADGTTSKTVTLTAQEAYTGTTTVDAFVWTSLGEMQTIK